MASQSPDVLSSEQGRDSSAAVRTGTAVNVPGDRLEVPLDKAIKGSCRQVGTLEIRTEAPALLFVGLREQSDPVNVFLDNHASPVLSFLPPHTGATCRQSLLYSLYCRVAQQLLRSDLLTRLRMSV